MRILITICLLAISIQSINAKKIEIEVLSDINKKVRIDILIGKNNMDVGNILRSGEIPVGGSLKYSKVPVPKNSYLKIIAKVIETGEVIEIPWERFIGKKYSKRISNLSNDKFNQFDFKDLTSIDNLFKYDPKRFVKENKADILSLKPLSNFYEEYLGGMLLFTMKTDSVNYITHFSPKTLGTEMPIATGGGTTYTEDFDFKHDINQSLDVNIVNLFELTGSLKNEKLYHFKIAYNSVGSIKYTSPDGTTIYKALSRLDSLTIHNIGMLKYKYGDKLYASQITEGYGFEGIYAEISEYTKTNIQNEISYNTFVETGGYYNRSYEANKNTVIAPSYLGYYANTNNHIDLSFAQIKYVINIISMLSELSEIEARIFYKAQKNSNSELPEYTTKEAAIEALFNVVSPMINNPSIKSNLNLFLNDSEMLKLK